MAAFSDIWTITTGHRLNNQVVLFVTQQTDFVAMKNQLEAAGFLVTVADYFLWAVGGGVKYQIVKHDKHKQHASGMCSVYISIEEAKIILRENKLGRILNES